MSTIKAFTTIEQSRKLAQILPLESADMMYSMVNGRCTPFIRIETIEEMYEDDVLCWSLAALLSVLERGALFKTPQGWACQSYIDFKAVTSDHYDNPIDACVAIIEHLYELKIL